MITRCHENCLDCSTQRLPTNVLTTSYWPVTNSNSDLDNKTEQTISNFEDPRKLGVVVTLKGRTSRKIDLDKLEDRANKNYYEYQQRKMPCSALDWNNPRHQYTDCIGETWQKGQVDIRMNMSQQRALPANKANQVLGNTTRNMSSRSNHSLCLHTWNTVSQHG